MALLDDAIAAMSGLENRLHNETIGKAPLKRTEVAYRRLAMVRADLEGERAAKVVKDARDGLFAKADGHA